MNSGSAVDITSELPLVYLAAGAIGLPVSILWLNHRITQKPSSPLAQSVVIITCATGCVILLTFASAFLPPGSFDAKSTSLGPFTFEAQGQAATLLISIFSIFSATAVVVNFVLKHVPKPPRERRQPERPIIKGRDGELPPATP